MKKTPIYTLGGEPIVAHITDDEGVQTIDLQATSLTEAQAYKMVVSVLQVLAKPDTLPAPPVTLGVTPPADLPDWRAAFEALTPDPSDKDVDNALLDYLECEPFLGALRREEGETFILTTLSNRLGGKLKMPTLRGQMGRLRTRL